MGILYKEASIVRPVKDKNASIYTPFTQGLTARFFLEISWKKRRNISLLNQFILFLVAVTSVSWERNCTAWMGYPHKL